MSNSYIQHNYSEKDQRKGFIIITVFLALMIIGMIILTKMSEKVLKKDLIQENCSYIYDGNAYRFQ